MKPPRFLINFLIRHADKKIEKARNEIRSYFPHDPRAKYRTWGSDEELLARVSTDHLKWWENFKSKCEGLKR